MAETSPTGASAELKQTASATIAIITQLEQVLCREPPNGQDKGQDEGQDKGQKERAESQPDPFTIAHNSASLIQAHSTKLSLLIINEPFTPSAIAKILRELVAGPFPGLATAVELFHPDQYTSAARRDLAWMGYKVLRDFKVLVESIPNNGKALAQLPDRGRVPVTGLIWASCMEIIDFAKLGVAEHLVCKVEHFRDTLQDILEELREWGDEVDEDDNDDGGIGNENEDEVEQITNGLEDTHIENTQAMLDELMDTRPIPRNDPDRIRERLESCVRRLQLTKHFYQALIKRRLKTLPPFPAPPSSAVPSRVDEVIVALKTIPDRFGDLVSAFYEQQPREIDALTDESFLGVFAASEMVLKSWTGEKDEFTNWVLRFQVEIRRA